MKTLKVFFRKNAVYLIIAFCILAIGLSMMLVLLNKGNDDTLSVKDSGSEVDIYQDIIEDDKPSEVVNPIVDEEPVEVKVEYILPVASFTSVQDYCETLAYNSTLKRYQSHKATDFYAEEGTNVLSIYDGRVESVVNDLLKGYTVTIDHGNGLKSVYNSLLDGDMVVVGQRVKKGDVIGEVSLSNRQEYKDGAHLHFELLENGTSIDPEKYLPIQDK